MASTQISGKVENANGNAVGGAVVEAIPHDSTKDRLRTTTASDGTYSFTSSLYIDPHDYHVVARWTDSDGNPHQATPNYPFVTAENTVTIVEGFEGYSGDISNSSYNGNTGDFSVQQTIAYEGDYALKTTGGSGTGYEILNTNKTIARGSTIEYRIYSYGSDNNASFYFGATTNDPSTWDGYGIRIQGFDNTVTIDRYDNGSSTELAAPSLSSYPSGEWLRVKIEYLSSDIAVTVFDSNDNELLSRYSVTDSNHGDGGIGFEYYKNDSNDFVWDRVVTT